MALLALIAAASAFVGGSVSRDRDDDGGAPTEVPAYELRIVSSTCDYDGEAITLTGEVTNVGHETYEEVRAVGTFADGSFRPLAQAVGSLGEMKPGDIKGFTLAARQDGVRGCSVAFFLPSERKLRTDDSIIP
ncbi:MAG: hypothetical protein WEC75_09025 [Dehalococcoidia bacterium]